jgi:hypothetical protein
MLVTHKRSRVSELEIPTTFANTQHGLLSARRKSMLVTPHTNSQIAREYDSSDHATLPFTYIVVVLKGTPKTQTAATEAPIPAMGGNGPPPPGGNGAPPSTVKSNSVQSLSVNHYAAIYCSLI